MNLNMNIPESKLLPCPFCGCHAYYHRDLDGCTFVSCSNGCCTMRVDWNPERWQKRVKRGVPYTV